MSLPHLSPRAWFAAVCLSSLAIASPLRAAPSIKSAFLRFGGSPRLPVAEWAYLQYWLENPDDTAVTVRLSLRAAERGRAVFDKTVRLAPRTQLHGRELVTADASSEYVLSLFRGTERLERTNVPVSSTDQPLAAALLFLNDDPDFSGTSELAKPGQLRDPVTVATVTARSAPHHWGAYGHTRAIVVISPRYRDLCAAQFEALTQYVHRGGTVVFAHPQGTLAAAATPWAGLLPVVPLRVEQTEALPELDAWGAAWAAGLPAAQRAARLPLENRDGLAVLVSAEQGDGLTALRYGSSPLIRWRRCGLGRIGVVAIEPCQRGLVSSGALVPLWNHILAHAPPVFALGNLENSHILPTVLAHLTGFHIPSARAIGWLLYGYVALLVTLLVGGFLCRRQASSWGIAAAAGLVLTCGIFAWAFRQNAARPAAGAALLDLRTSTGERTSGSAVVSLFAKRDLRPELIANAAALLRPLPSPARGKRREPLDAPLIVNREGDQVGLAGITVQALKPREFGALYTQLPIPATPIAVGLEDGPARLDGPALPAALADGRFQTFLLAPAALLPVSRDGARLTGIAATPRLLETDPFLIDLGRYLVDGAFPRPALVVLAPVSAGSGGLPLAFPGFTPGGYTVHLLPASLTAVPGRIRLAPEFLRLETVGSGSRSVLREDPTQSTVLRMPALVLALDVVLPEVCADLRPEEVSVDLDVGNVGGNVLVEPRLVRPPLSTGTVLPSDPSEAALWQSALAPTTVADGLYRFTDPRVAALIQPAYGRCRLLLRVSQKTVLTVATEADRTNRWRLNRLRVAMVGTLPENGPQTRRF